MSDVLAFALNAIDISVPTKTSDLQNDSSFITNTVNNLANYYLKSETYTKTEVSNLIDAAVNGRFEKVQTLPVTGEANVIYLVPKTTALTNNVYDEYIWQDNAWEQLGSTEIDLSGYVTDTDLATALADYVTTSAFNTAIANYYTKTEVGNLLDDKVDKVSGKGLSTNDYSNTDKAIVDGVTSALADKVDKVIGKGLSTNDYDNTDKAKVGKIDETTTHVSGNPISISGLKSNQLAINPIITFSSSIDKVALNVFGKNLLPSSTIQNGSKNGLIYTVYKNSNGDVEKISVSGKATAVSEIIVQSSLNLKNGEYILSGCPASGSDNTYRLDYLNSAYTQSKDTGSGVTFTVNNDANYIRIRWLDTTNTYSNIEFKPMIRLSTVADSTFEPYHNITISESLGETVSGGSWNVRTEPLLSSPTSVTTPRR